MLEQSSLRHSPGSLQLVRHTNPTKQPRTKEDVVINKKKHARDNRVSKPNIGNETY